MTNLEKLTKRVQELFPELMELSFGCEVHCEQALENDNGDFGDFYGRVIQQNTKDEYDVLLSEVISDDLDEGKTEMVIPYVNPEIIGHPIQLHYVLQAIDKVGFSDVWSIACDGYFQECPDFDGMLVETKYKWDLTKDLSQQSEEIINFLTEILCQ